MRKNQKGITLIALVVTIIVLLILAGVSIAMITGQSGILGQARQSAWKTKLGEAQTTVALRVNEYWADYLGNTYGGSTKQYDWGSETDVITKACEAAEKELGSEFDVYANVGATNGVLSKITINYTSGSKHYSVVGTVENGASTPKWGAMDDKAAATNS